MLTPCLVCITIDRYRPCDLQALSRVTKESPPGGRNGAGFSVVSMEEEDEDATEAFERDQQQVSAQSSIRHLEQPSQDHVH